MALKSVVKTSHFRRDPDGTNDDWSDLVNSVTLGITPATVEANDLKEVLDQTAKGTLSSEMGLSVRHRADQSEMATLHADLLSSSEITFQFREKTTAASASNLEYKVTGILVGTLNVGGARGSIRESSLTLHVNSGTFTDGTTTWNWATGAVVP